MGAEAVTKARQKRKADLVYIMGGKCCLCGYDKCQQALEFHHIDKSTKEYGLSSGNCHKLEDDIKEVKKCALVCSNCHKEIEVFKYETFNTFDEQRYNEIVELRKKEERTCKNCGKEISVGATYCSDCWSLVKRKVDRPEREELKFLIRNFPFTQIAKQYGVVDNTIRKWCDAYNLPRTKKEISSLSDFEWESI